MIYQDTIEVIQIKPYN